MMRVSQNGNAKDHVTVLGNDWHFHQVPCTVMSSTDDISNTYAICKHLYYVNTINKFQT